MTYHPMVNRIIKDPIALAIVITIPALLFTYDGRTEWDYSVKPPIKTDLGWHFRFLFDAYEVDRTQYNYAALVIIWAVAIIRWKWQKEDRAKQG